MRSGPGIRHQVEWPSEAALGVAFSVDGERTWNVLGAGLILEVDSPGDQRAGGLDTSTRNEEQTAIKRKAAWRAERLQERPFKGGSGVVYVTYADRYKKFMVAIRSRIPVSIKLNRRE